MDKEQLENNIWRIKLDNIIWHIEHNRKSLDDKVILDDVLYSLKNIKKEL